MATIFTVVLVLVLLVLRVPIGAGFLLASSLALALFYPGYLDILPLLSFRTFDNFTLLAVPLFIMAADLMLTSGVTEVLVRLLVKYTARTQRLLPPGVVALAMFFAGITGSSVAEAAALGRLVYPTMRKLGYSPRSVAGLIASAATLGVLLPPSVTLVIYGGLTQTPVNKLFLAGLLPGVLSGIGLMVFSLFLTQPDLKAVESVSPARDTTGRGPALRMDHTSYSEIAKLIATAFGPMIVFGGIYGGIGTPSEVAALLVLYAAVMAFFLRGGKPVAHSVRRSAYDTAVIFLIIIGTGSFAFLATADQTPQRITAAVLGLGLNKWEFLIALNLVCLIIGSFLEGLSMLLVTLPLLFPPAMALGITPIHFGIILAVNIEVAAITPPAGINLFAIARVSGYPFDKVVRAVLRYYPISYGFLILFTFVPWLSGDGWIK